MFHKGPSQVKLQQGTDAEDSVNFATR